MCLLKVGSVVICTAGKEKGMLFAVTGIDGSRPEISDGRTRRLNKPKTKSAKHLVFTGIVLEDISLSSNLKLRQALKRVAEHWRN